MTNILDSIEDQAVPIDDLQPHPENPRRGDIDAIAVSLATNGQYRPIVVARDGTILAGNHTWKAAQQLGWTHIAAVRLNLDPHSKEAKRIVLTDNRTADLGTYDDKELLGLLDALDEDLTGTGYDETDLADLRALVGDIPDADPDFIPPATDKKTWSAPGDLIKLGRHTLYVGDSTTPEAVNMVMGGQPAHLLITDPPYGVEYVGKTADALTIQNDEEQGIRQFLANAFTNARNVMADGACFYTFGPTAATSLEHHLAVVDAGFQVRVGIVWVKDRFVLGHRDFHSRHELILYGWKDGKHTFNAGRDQDDVWEIPRPAASREHPTMKPVELYQRAINLSTHAGQNVLDLFGGSGTNIIAAEITGRNGYAIEYDPRYADVICQRYLTYTGEIPTRASDGEPFTPQDDTA